MRKVLTFNYDSTYDPAMPMMDIVVGTAGNEPRIILVGLVDSGADATIIPHRFLEQLRARRYRKQWMRGTASGRKLVDLYRVSLRLGSFEIAHLGVVCDTENDDVIIGRDVLNHLAVNLNGPANSVEIAFE